MAFVPLIRFKVGESAVGTVIYNDANGRLTRFEWSGIPPGYEVRVTIFDTLSASHPDPVFAGSFTESGQTPIAGSYNAVEETFQGETFMALPPNIIIVFSGFVQQA